MRSAEPTGVPEADSKHNWDLNILHFANKYRQPANQGYSRKGGWALWGPGEMHYKYILTLLDFRNQRVLEIGPHEGQHTVIIDKMGAREIVGLEVNAENCEKCLRVKELFQIENAHFYQCNLEDLYTGRTESPFPGGFDIVFCSGVLYHMPDPGRALKYFRSQSSVLFLCTHYIEDQGMELILPRIGSGRYNLNPGNYVFEDQDYSGMWYNEFEDSKEDPGRQDGVSPKSFWPRENGLVNMLTRAGYGSIQVLGKEIVNGMPYIYILAK